MLGCSPALPRPEKTELTFYYPIAVGGPLTKVVDGIVAGFEKEHPNVKVNAVYAGNYDDTRIRALAATRPASRRSSRCCSRSTCTSCSSRT